jgi:hypothetical protein
MNHECLLYYNIGLLIPVSFGFCFSGLLLNMVALFYLFCASGRLAADFFSGATRGGIFALFYWL